MLGRRRLHTDVTSPFWIIWLHYIVGQSFLPKSSISHLFFSVSPSGHTTHRFLCIYCMCIHSVRGCVAGGVQRHKSEWKKRGETDPPPLTFLGPPGQEAWRARSDFWSRLFPAAYKNKWSKLPRVITRKWLRLAASHFSTHNTACISKWQSHAAWCIYWL